MIESGMKRRCSGQVRSLMRGTSLCMIARDSASTLKRSLASVRRWIDDIVVVDTGSVDETPQIAAGLGARVFSFPWCDDFSAARNESIRHACGEWIFWLDSDEFIDDANGRKLRNLATSASDAGLMAFLMQQHSATRQSDGQLAPAIINQVRMFRNKPELRFEGRVHEQIMPAVNRLHGQVAWTDIRIDHSGYDDPLVRRRELDRDLRLLGLELADRPNHPFALFNLGMTLNGLGQPLAAIAAMDCCLSAAAGDEPYLANAHMILITAQMQARTLDAATRICHEGRRRFPNNSTLLFQEGVLARETGRPADAIRAFESVLQSGEPMALVPADPDFRRYKTHQNLALAYGDLSRHEIAERYWRLVVAAAPEQRAGWQGLTGSLLRQDKLSEAETALQTLCDRWPDNAEAFCYLRGLSLRLGGKR